MRRPEPPADVHGIARARWARQHRVTVSGASAASLRFKGKPKLQQRALQAKLQKMLGADSSLTSITLRCDGEQARPVNTLRSSLPQQLPAVCLAEQLGLRETSSQAAIIKAFRELRARRSDQVPHVLLVHELVHFDDACLEALLAVLRRHAKIFALNLQSVPPIKKPRH